MASFRQLMANLADLQGVPSRIAKPVAETISAHIDDQFSRGEDPYGDPWTPLKPATIRKGRGHPPLTDSGDMRASVSVRPQQGSGVEIAIGTSYAHFHQTGTRHMVERSILPDRDELPQEWQDAIEGETDTAFRRSMGGR